jgi:phosphoribosyl-AMP cyclohydrolase
MSDATAEGANTAQRFAASLKYDDHGLIPAVIQDATDNTVLMVAYMNSEAVLRTLSTGRTNFYSRSRRKMWMKGEESGNVQEVVEVLFDCDADCLLIRVIQRGGAACHTGYRSCFFRSVGQDGAVRTQGKPLFDPAKVYGQK